MRRRPLKALFVLIPALSVGLLALPAVAGAATKPTAPASFSFSGAGWGHGVGMSQYGAYGQALEGRSADQILRHYYTGSRIAAFRDDVDLRVNLAYLKQRVRMRVEALAAGAPAVQIAAGGKTVKAGRGDIVEIAVKGDALAVLVDGSLVAKGPDALVRWSGTRAPGATGSTPAVLNVVSGSTSFDSPGHRYRYGRVEVRARYSPTVAATALSAVNVVRLHDEYVFGVGEMPSSWPAAALQAQAIASRGYALVKYRQGVRSGCWCHVFADTSDQVFVGWSKQSGPSGARWTAAVKATTLSSTASKTVMVDGKPAQTFFFSSSGGRTQNSEDVWGSKLSYLRSVDDRWSLNKSINPTNAAWGPRKRTQQQVAAAFGLPNVARLDLSDRYASGAVRLGKAWTVGGTLATVSGPSLVSRLSLTSRWFRTTGGTTSAPAPDPKQFRVSISDTSVSIKVGDRGRLTGSVSPATRAAGATVSLRRLDSTGKKWLFAGSARVNRNGSYAFPVSGASAALRTYKVYKPAAKCGTGCVVRAASSANARVAIVDAYQIQAVIPATVVRSGEPVRVRGKVSPARIASGRSVVIKRYDAAGRRWANAGTARIDGSGRFLTDLSALPTGRLSLRVYKAKDGCSAGLCTMASALSADLGLTVQRRFSIVIATATEGRRSISVRGKVTPVAAAVGDRVTVQRWAGGRWVYLGPARVGADGRFTRTFTNLPLRSTPLRVWKAAEGCSAAACIHPAGVSAVRTVTPR